MSAVAEITRFGFKFGAAEVVRTAELPEERVVISVKTKAKTLDVYVSRTGKSLRVFSGGKELK